MDNQGVVYATFIEGELKTERERRANLDSKGSSLITSSGGVVTLLAAVGAFLAKSGAFVLPSVARIPLAVSLGAFVIAVGCGIMATWLHKYTVADVVDLDAMITSHWTDDATDSRNVVSKLNIATLDTLRKKNGRKAEWARAGQIAQLAALLALSLVVLMTLWEPSSKAPTPSTPSPSHSAVTPSQTNSPGATRTP
jgi:hypothetical protein